MKLFRRASAQGSAASTRAGDGPLRAARDFAFERLESRVLFATVPAGFVDETVAGGLSGPTAMEFAPDGRLFVAQQEGALRVIKNGALLTTPFASLNVGATANTERGLLGVAFDPNYASNRFVYVYHTVPASPGVAVHNRVTRLTADATNPDVAVAGSATSILDLEALSATNHNGGAIHFGSDGKLYVAVGDNAVRANAQTLNNRLGKMLRINPDGSAPSDNPFFTNDGITQPRDVIWALGLRNPFTFAVQPGTGRIHINDVGENSFEEVNLGAGGANFGWPNYEGPENDPNFVAPLIAYPRSGPDINNSGRSIGGGAFYNPATPQFPVEYAGDYFYAESFGPPTGGTGAWIRRYDQATNTNTLFASRGSFIVDLKTGADGMLYYLARGTGSVQRVRAVAPAVQSIQINDGNVQRSKIRDVTVTFTRPVTLDPGAIGVVGRNGAGAGVTVNTAPVAGSNTAFRLTFSGAGAVGGSLPDGVYDLTIQAAAVHDAAVPAQTLAANATLKFHRLFADADGDGDVDNADRFDLRSTTNKREGHSAFKWYFDYDADADVDNADLFEVRGRARIAFRNY